MFKIFNKVSNALAKLVIFTVALGAFEKGVKAAHEYWMANVPDSVKQNQENDKA